MTTRVLGAEDHEAWRRYISSALRNNLQCQIVGEAADGWEAVQKAERLRPDLIILDVGLPTLNGIEAARRILTLAPDSRILFVSGHRPLDIVQAALGTGADGYVLKSDAGSDLLPAVDAIIQGKPLHQKLQAAGLDVDLAIEEGRYVSLDVADSLSTFMVNGWPDEARFWKATTTLVAAAARASKGMHAGVAACGECSPTLWREGRAAAAIRVENLWEEFAQAYDVDVLCGYSLAAPLDDEEKQIVERICAAHSAVRSRE